jgi:TRAP-type transport system small permease protein
MRKLFLYGDYARRTIAVIAAVVLSGLAVLIFVDVIGRYVLSSPLPGTVELIESLMAIVTFGAFVQAVHNRDHIRLELLSSLAPRKWQVRLEKLGQLAVLLVMLGATWGLTERTISLKASGDLTPVLHLPLYIMTGISLGVLCVACLVSALELARPAGSQENSDGNDNG